MNIAVRFPIKDNKPFYYGLIFLHLWVIVTAYELLSVIWMIALVVLAVAFSFYKTRQQYLCVTQSIDDLCWSGENWLMHDPENQAEIIYLELLETSWITASFCLLKFQMNNREESWLFSRATLGKRLFSELCYLARLDISHNLNEVDS